MIDDRISRRKLSQMAASVVAGVVGAGRLLTPQQAAAAEPMANAPKPKRLNRLIEALESGQPSISGDHWLFADFEHTNGYSIDKIEKLLLKLGETRNAKGQQPLAPIIRIPAEGNQPSRYIVKQVLERGAMGIIIPQVDTAEQMLKICEFARYPQANDAKHPMPRGVRGLAGIPAMWGLSQSEYIAKADLWPLNPDGEIFLMPQIETPEGVKNIDAILDVPGVAGVLIGPMDLSMTHGRGPWVTNGTPTHHPEVEAAIATVAKASVAKKKYSGMVTWDAAETQKYLGMGFKYIYETTKKGSAPDKSLFT